MAGWAHPHGAVDQPRRLGPVGYRTSHYELFLNSLATAKLARAEQIQTGPPAYENKSHVTTLIG